MKSMRLPAGTAVEAQVLGLAWGGHQVAQIVYPPEAAGKKCFVQQAVPGEYIGAVIDSDRGSYGYAQLGAVLTRSTDRREPKCRYYGFCGGCQLQHIDIVRQRELKREMVQSMLISQAKLHPLEGVHLLGAELPAYHYRNRINLHLEEAPAAIGFHRAATRQVVDIEECAIADSVLNSALSAVRKVCAQISPLVASLVIENIDGAVGLRPSLRENLDTTAQKAAEIVVNCLASALADHRYFIDVRYFGRTIAASSNPNTKDKSPRSAIGHFSQVNLAANQVLVDSVVASVTQDHVADLYSGSGNFAIPLAQAGRRVAAVETDPRLTELGALKAKQLGIHDRISFVNLSCEQYLKSAYLAPSVIIDPPRSGAKQVVKLLARAGAKEVTYVSCSLPTLARDLKLLVNDGYTLVKTLVLDMFPQTFHVETISHLRILT